MVVVEEANELPFENYYGLESGCRSRGTPLGDPFAYPLKIVLVHNRVDEDHWIAEEFPLAGELHTLDGHAHIRADLHSNGRNLGPDAPAATSRTTPWPSVAADGNRRQARCQPHWEGGTPGISIARGMCGRR